ncbi:AlpA family transcriptional regulator [Brumicola nitratireducens]|uniref:Phage transcriptional regulator, AlpA n=1 Tax=Glaciecola nitratireducens (strain JCM 12485 / KCTC 12276 / FR1064) TaxID=1085623 RepID=G4QGX1_GLANF|nr:AlpA family transcriptional regulator [Glaciecola nitratireducens]AEP29916.1 phage transcriptional regulator, AlpA [Glaciecola nitratireducens FR1064]
MTTTLEPFLKERVIPLTRILRRKEVLQLCGIGQTHLYDLIKRNEFPRPVNLTGKIVGWVDNEIQDWIDTKIQQRDQ